MSIHFIRGIIQQPFATGAIAPSSPFLAREMLRHWPRRQGGVVVEYGPGTGPITKRILGRQRSETYLGFELNPVFVRRLKKRFPGIDICDCSAEHLQFELNKRELAAADLIVSSLPWANFSPDLQDHLLEGTVEGLCSGGAFSTFAYVHALKLPTAKKFSRKLKQHFGSVRTSHIIWGNLPPAIIYHCRK